MTDRITQAFQRLARRARDRAIEQAGFTMLPAVTAVMVGSLLSLGAWTAAHNDMKLQNVDRWSKVAYSQAESGVTDYVQHMAEDPGYWQYCDAVPGITGDGIGQTAVNDTDRSGTSGSLARRWMPQPAIGTSQDAALTAQYTIDLIPENGYASCKSRTNRNESMVDRQTGVIRIRATGRAGPPVPSGQNITNWRNAHWKKRSIVIEFRRKGFLDYAYFTDKEGLDPVVGDASQKAHCASYYTPATGASNSTGRYYWNGSVSSRQTECTEIMFANGDDLGGPFHTNDGAMLQSNGGATIGNPGMNDSIEVFDSRCPFRLTGNTTHGKPAGVTDTASGASSYSCPPATGTGSVRPTINGKLLIGAAAGYLPLPDSNQDLKIYGDPTNTDPDYQGYTFTGTTKITLSAGQVTVTNASYNGGVATPLPYPSSGVIYVQNDTSAASCDYSLTTDYPSLPTGCALVEVKGTYDTPLTIASEADIVITGDLRKSTTSDTAVLGLIGDNFVRVRHYGTAGSCGNATDTSSNPRVNYIDAAILALSHSFIVDRWNCGGSLGTLHVSGVLAQQYRGPVGTSGGSTGYIKDYNYDYRYKYLTPPHFLTPTLSTWRISRYREQVPPCACQ